LEDAIARAYESCHLTRPHRSPIIASLTKQPNTYSHVVPAAIPHPC
jgi:hypothetical protein